MPQAFLSKSALKSGIWHYVCCKFTYYCWYLFLKSIWYITVKISGNTGPCARRRSEGHRERAKTLFGKFTKTPQRNNIHKGEGGRGQKEKEKEEEGTDLPKKNFYRSPSSRVSEFNSPPFPATPHLPNRQRFMCERCPTQKSNIFLSCFSRQKYMGNWKACPLFYGDASSLTPSPFAAFRNWMRGA